MSKPKIYEQFPEYEQLKESQSKVAGQDFVPVIFNDVLTQEELEDMKNQFNNYPKETIDVQGFSGLGTLSIFLMNEDKVLKKIEEMASKALGEELEVLEYGGTRYSTEFGWEVKLGPHYDARPVDIYVFDFHVQSTIDWALFIEGDEFHLGDNQALMFSGTGSIHWRDPIRLKDGEVVDLIFFWLQHKNPRPLSKEHSMIMKDRQKMLLEKIDIMPPLSNKDWWEPIKISEKAEKYPHFEKLSTTHQNPLSHNVEYRWVLNNDNINEIYGLVNLDYEKSKQLEINNEFSKKIISFMNNVNAEFSLELKDILFKRYDKSCDISLETMPKYISHNRPIITLAIQLNSNTKWPFVIEGNEFSLSDTNGLTFSQTNQIFWRKDIELEEDFFIDMLYCNFYIKDNLEITKDQIDELDQKVKRFVRYN